MVSLSQSQNAIPVWFADPVTGNPTRAGGPQETLQLANNVSATGAQPAQAAYGGDYIWTITGTFGGTSAQLQSIGPDGVTWQNIGAAKTAPDTNGGTGVGFGSNALVRVVLTGGTPSGIYASASRVP